METIEILKQWNMENEDVVLHYESNGNQTWKVGANHFLKYYNNADELKKTLEINQALTNSGIPVARYLKTVTGDFTTPDAKYCLMEKIPGNHLDFENVTMQEIETIGCELAKLHQIFATVETKITFADNDFLGEWNGWIKPGLRNTPQELTIYVDQMLHEHSEKLPRNLIHRDVHFKNLLFQDGQLTGWLDFDLNRKDIRIFDLAYFLTGQLLGKIESTSDITKWQIMYQHVLIGYQNVAKLSTSELELLPVIMIAIELLFVSWWSSQNNDVEVEKALDLAKWLYENMV